MLCLDKKQELLYFTMASFFSVMADIIPVKRAARLAWLTALSKNVVAEAAKMDAAPEDAAAAKALADELVAAYNATDSAQATVDGKRQIERQTEIKNFKALRRYFARWKTLDKYGTTGGEAVLQLKSKSSRMDAGTFKPKITITVKGGEVIIQYRKRGVDALAIYSRLRGMAEWTRLGIDRMSPFIDRRPLADPAIAEVREYMARGVIKDEEVGVDSDIITVTFAG
jgi:hypothetical protein